jgi:hypothetical protein
MSRITIKIKEEIPHGFFNVNEKFDAFALDKMMACYFLTAFCPRCV